MERRSLKDLPDLIQSRPLIMPSEIQKNIEQDLPSNSIDRCHQRWADLFFGVWRALYERKPALIFGLLESMKSHGLIEDDYLSADLFLVNPPDDILKRVRTFRTSAVIPKLKKGKLSPWKEYDYFGGLMDYIKTLSLVRNIRRKYRTPAFPLKLIKEKYLPQILSELRIVKRKNVPDKFLKEWISLPRKELAIRLVAHIHGLGSDAFKKRLTKAKQEIPFAKQWVRTAVK